MEHELQNALKIAPEGTPSLRAKLRAIEQAQDEERKEEEELERRKKAIAARHDLSLRKARTRKLIQRGAIVESLHPAIPSMENAELQKLLLTLIQSKQGLALVAKTEEEAFMASLFDDEEDSLL